jgi:hypothetical protein
MATKKMQEGGTKTYKGTKGVTTVKKEANTSVPDITITHKGKKGSTTKTSNVLWADRSHKGSKGLTRTNWGGKEVIHKGKKGTTTNSTFGYIAHQGKKGTTTVYSNKDGSKDVLYLSNDRKKPTYNKTIKVKNK